MKTKELRNFLRNRIATDSSGKQYELEEFTELVSLDLNGTWSPWQPRNGHGQFMTLNGKPLERITAQQWETTDYPPVQLTLLP